jgi:putative transposase
VFRDDGDRQVFLVTLKGVIEVCDWELLAFCLMTNHVHLVVRTPRPNLGEGMQRLLGTYAKFFNWRYERSGHVFRRPFKSEPIRDDRQLAAAIAYVGDNPVRAKLCMSAGEWRWSSHGAVRCVQRQALMGAARGSRGSNEDPAEWFPGRPDHAQARLGITTLF